MMIKRILLTIITITLMATIFWFSSQPADESTEISNEVGYIIGRIFVPGFNQLSPEEQYNYADSIDFYVRKSAHASEYLLLGVLMALTLYSWFLECPYLVFLMGWLATTLYAESDEIHQLFVQGRACMLRDVGIDAAGAVLGILLLAIIHHLNNKKKKAHEF